jgi:hypothetical protein
MVHFFERLTQTVEESIHVAEDSAELGARVIEKTDGSLVSTDDRLRASWSASYRTRA